LTVSLIAAGAAAAGAAGRAHYEKRYGYWAPSFAATSCGGSDTVKQRIHIRGKRFRLVDPRVGERVGDGTWYPPTPDPSTDYNDFDNMVRVERARLSRDRRGRFVRVTVRGLPERCNSESTGCDQGLALCPRADWGWEIEVPITVRYRKRIPTTISCSNRSGTYVWPRRGPSHCMLFAHNLAIHAYQFDLHNIHWRHWGAREATASAVTVYVGMGVTVRRRVRLRAGRPRTVCGHYAYTRLQVTFTEDGSTYLLRPPACHRALR